MQDNATTHTANNSMMALPEIREQAVFSKITRLMSIWDFCYGTQCNNKVTWRVLTQCKNWKPTYKMLFQNFRLGSRNTVWRCESTSRHHAEILLYNNVGYTELCSPVQCQILQLNKDCVYLRLHNSCLKYDYLPWWQQLNNIKILNASLFIGHFTLKDGTSMPSQNVRHQSPRDVAHCPRTETSKIIINIIKVFSQSKLAPMNVFLFT
jgi:hypothetical protein